MSTRSTWTPVASAVSRKRVSWIGSRSGCTRAITTTTRLQLATAGRANRLERGATAATAPRRELQSTPSTVTRSPTQICWPVLPRRVRRTHSNWSTPPGPAGARATRQKLASRATTSPQADRSVARDGPGLAPGASWALAKPGVVGLEPSPRSGASAPMAADQQAHGSVRQGSALHLVAGLAQAIAH